MLFKALKYKLKISDRWENPRGADEENWGDKAARIKGFHDKTEKSLILIILAVIFTA